MSSADINATRTFLFTDIEGSTRKWELFPDCMRAALERHDALLHTAIECSGGHVFKTIGDAFCAAFPDAAGAVAAVLQIQQTLAGEDWGPLGPLRLRVGIHSGPAQQRGGDYFGPTLNRAARLQAIGHGGQALLSQAAAVQLQDALPDGIWLQDLGSHRLKDLGRPEHVFQICASDLPNDFPPVRSLQTFASNLPLQMTSFVGRDQEMARLGELLAQHRLVTLTGAGGTGKTRLALQAAAERLEHYGDGVWFVDLAPLSDPALVVQAVASVLGVREEPGRLLTETVTDALRAQTILLLLDNGEHVVDACASLAETVLQTCPSARLLVTSREALRVPGERVWRVPALSQPDPKRLPLDEKDIGAALLDYDSVRLFVERARAQQETFTLTRANAQAVAQICRRLDGIPLALELAAARVRVMSVEQIAARLDDRFRLLTGGARTLLPRQQTLRALIDWSYDLLNDQEKMLLSRLSVFAGGWTLDAAEAICADDTIADWEVLDLLTGLADKSLVVYEEDSARYHLQETMREYAGERLAANGVGARARHRDYFVEAAEQAALLLQGPESEAALSRLETEHANLRAALAWCETEPEDTDAWLRLCGSLGRFWDIHGYLSEGRQWLSKALAQPSAEEASPARGLALNWVGNLSCHGGDVEAAQSFYERSLAVRQQLADTAGIAGALNNLGNLAFEQGDHDRARGLFEESLSLKRRLGDVQGIANSLGNLGNLASEQGDNETARACYEESLHLFQRLGNAQGTADAMSNLGVVASEQNDWNTARDLFQQSLDVRCRIGDPKGIADSLAGLGDVAMAEGRTVHGVRLCAASDALREQIEAPLAPHERRRQEQERRLARLQLGEDAFAAAFAEGHALTWEQAVQYALGENADA